MSNKIICMIQKNTRIMIFANVSIQKRRIALVKYIGTYCDFRHKRPAHRQMLGKSRSLQSSEEIP